MCIICNVGTHEYNYRKRQLLRYVHNIKHKWKHEKLEPPVHRDDEEDEEDEEDNQDRENALVKTPEENSEENSEENKSTLLDSNVLLEDQTQLETIEKPNHSQTWTEWALSLFWKSLGY